MDAIQKMYNETDSFGQFLGRYIDYHKIILEQLKSLDLKFLINEILRCHQQEKKIIVLGNGGSAANATHISTGLSFITRTWDKPLRSLSLASDAILMSSLANDFAYDEIFYRQLQVHLQEGDLVIALSVSGNSKNIIKAVEFAKSKGNLVIGLTGSDGGELVKLANHCVHLKTDSTLFGVTEDIHMILGHALTYYLEYHLKTN